MPKRPSLRQEQRLLTKQRIAGAALEVFSKRGYNAATIDDIVNVAGIARATFYLHFKNKLDLVECLTNTIHPGVAALYNDLDELIATNRSRVREAIRPWLFRAIRWFEENETLVLLWQEISISEPEFQISPAVSLAECMPSYLAEWPKELRDMARLRVVLLIQLLTRAFLLTQVRHALPVDMDQLVDVIADIWATGLFQSP